MRSKMIVAFYFIGADPKNVNVGFVSNYFSDLFILLLHMKTVRHNPFHSIRLDSFFKFSHH